MTKMVQLADDAYARLKARKRAGESFSDTVRRLTRPAGKLSDIAKIGGAKEKAAARKTRARVDELETKRTKRSLRPRSPDQ